MRLLSVHDSTNGACVNGLPHTLAGTASTADTEPIELEVFAGSLQTLLVEAGVRAVLAGARPGCRGTEDSSVR